MPGSFHFCCRKASPGRAPISIQLPGFKSALKKTNPRYLTATGVSATLVRRGAGRLREASEVGDYILSIIT